MINVSVNAQTDFAPGEIMFTGYDSDFPDAFSFVLLTDVVSGTVIAITDRGRSNIQVLILTIQLRVPLN